MWPPTSVFIALRIGGAKARPALRLSRKRVKICLPAVLCPADLPGEAEHTPRSLRRWIWEISVSWSADQCPHETQFKLKRTMPFLGIIRFVAAG